MNLQKVVLRDQKNTLRFLFQFQKMKTIVHPQQQQHPTSYKSHYHSSTIVQNNTVKNDENASLSNNNDNNSDEISTQTTTTSSSSSTSNSVDNDTTITKESASSKLKSMLFKDDVDGDNTAGDGVFSKLDEVSADDAVSSGAAKRDEASARASRQLARDNESDGGDRSVEEAESGGDGGVTATTRGGDSVGLQKTHGFGSDTPLKGRSDGDSALTDAPHLFDTDPLTSRVVDSATSVPGSLGAHKVVLEDLPQTATDEQVIAAMTMDFSCNRVVLFCIYIFGFPIAFVFFFFSNFEKIGRVFIFFFFFRFVRASRSSFVFCFFVCVSCTQHTHNMCVPSNKTVPKHSTSEAEEAGEEAATTSGDDVRETIVETVRPVAVERFGDVVRGRARRNYYVYFADAEQLRLVLQRAAKFGVYVGGQRCSLYPSSVKRTLFIGQLPHAIRDDAHFRALLAPLGNPFPECAVELAMDENSRHSKGTSLHTHIHTPSLSSHFHSCCA